MLSLDRQNALREQYRQQHPDWQPATEVFADLVRQYLRPSARILDMGCGRGGLVEQLDHPLAQVVGIDPDWVSLREHRLKLPRAAAFSDYLPFAANRFDVVYASWVLEHLAQPILTFSAVRRVLRKGGVFVFVTPNGRHPLATLNQGLGRFAAIQGRLVERLYDRDADDAFPTFYRANTAAALEKLCRESGLKVVSLQAIPDPTYLAFNGALFRLMSWFEGRLDPSRKLHLVGVAQRL